MYNDVSQLSILLTNIALRNRPESSWSLMIKKCAYKLIKRSHISLNHSEIATELLTWGRVSAMIAVVFALVVLALAAYIFNSVRKPKNFPPGKKSRYFAKVTYFHLKALRTSLYFHRNLILMGKYMKYLFICIILNALTIKSNISGLWNIFLRFFLWIISSFYLEVVWKDSSAQTSGQFIQMF